MGFTPEMYVRRRQLHLTLYMSLELGLPFHLMDLLMSLILPKEVVSLPPSDFLSQEIKEVKVSGWWVPKQHPDKSWIFLFEKSEEVYLSKGEVHTVGLGWSIYDSHPRIGKIIILPYDHLKYALVSPVKFNHYLDMDEADQSDT